MRRIRKFIRTADGKFGNPPAFHRAFIAAAAKKIEIFSAAAAENTYILTLDDDLKTTIPAAM